MIRSERSLWVRLASAEVLVLVMIAPAVLFPTATRALALLVVPVIWYGHHRSGERWVPATPLNASVVVLLAAVAVSCVVTPSLAKSLGKVCGVLFSVALFWALCRWTNSPVRLRRMLHLAVSCATGLALVGLLGTAWMEKLPALGRIIESLPRAIRGVPGATEGFHPNAVAGCLVLFIPLQLALIVAHDDAADPAVRKWPIALLQVLLLLLTATTLLLTQSRGAWTGIGIAGFCFLCGYRRSTRLVAAAMGLAAVVLAARLGPARVLDLVISHAGAGMAGNVSGRIELWSRAIDLIQDFPVTGLGMNMFRMVVQRLYPTFVTMSDLDVSHAHNHLLQAALDLGIPGLIAYLAIWFGAAAMLARVLYRPATPYYRTVAIGLAASLTAHFTFNFTDTIGLGTKPGFLFWLVLALVTALHDLNTRRRYRTNPAALASE